MGLGSVSRRGVMATALAGSGLAAATPAAAAAGPEAQVEAALRAFLTAFENCDLPAMAAAFAPEATSFDRTTMSPAGQASIRLDPWRRVAGPPPGMWAVAESLKKTGSGPPYQRLDPQDLLIQASADMAVCSFHLTGPHLVGRRTIVMAKRPGGWKIIHLHASQVTDA